MLNIGEIGVLNRPGILTCFGLGSCIGLFLYDRIHKVGGGAHIMLPTSAESKEGISNSVLRYADHAIVALIQQMKTKGADINGMGIRAKLVGGAHLFKGEHLQVGKKNIEAVIKYLTKNKIYIASKDIGGTVSRTARFYTVNGNVEVSTSTYKYII